MRCVRLLCLLVAIGAAAVAWAGDIQVFCEPGLRVYLDDELVGISSRLDDGHYLTDVGRGAHTVRVEKDGFVPQTFEVAVGQDPIEMAVGDFTPVAPEPDDVAPTAEPAGRPLGSLVVTSAPQNCVVEIDGTPHTKTSTQLTIGGLTAGEHTVTFIKPGYEPVSEQVTVHPGGTVAVRGNLKAGELEAVLRGQGALRVLCRPAHCTVRIMGMIKTPSGGLLNLTHLPAGDHKLAISISGRVLTNDIAIMDDHRTIVEVSFFKGDDPFVVSHRPL